MMLQLASACSRAEKPDASAAQSLLPTSAAQPSTLPELPAPGTTFVAPANDLEQGRCWLKLSRLRDEQQENVARAFRARNRLAQQAQVDVDPFTGYVRNATLRPLALADDPVVLSEPQLHRALVSALWTNADFFGMSPDEVLAIRWDQHGTTQLSSMLECFRGKVSRLRPEFIDMAQHSGQFHLRVCLDGHGRAGRVSVWPGGPPVPVCTEPQISEQAARSMPALFQTQLPSTGGGRFPTRYLVPTRRDTGRVQLALRRLFESGAGLSARSTSWRLAWGVDVFDGHWTIYLDAGDGHVIDVNPNFEN